MKTGLAVLAQDINSFFANNFVLSCGPLLLSNLCCKPSSKVSSYDSISITTNVVVIFYVVAIYQDYPSNQLNVFSSVPMPMNPEYFAQERKVSIKKTLDVSGVFPLKSQGQVIMDEVECSLRPEITEESLPLLLHEVL